MQLEHVVALVDLLILHDELEEAVVIVRRGQRWLQDRKAQRQWDALEDDREYDPPGLQREIGEAGMEANEGFALDINLRHRLGLIRLKLGNDDEAMVGLTSRAFVGFLRGWIWTGEGPGDFAARITS